MYCKKCGKENIDGTKFCIYCGEKFDNYISDAPNAQFNQNYYSNNKTQFNQANYSQQNNNFNQQQTFVPEKKKKSNKGVFIAVIVIVGLLIVGAFCFTVAKVVQQQRAIEAVDDIEMPEVPDLDIDSDFETSGNYSSGDASLYGIIDGDSYINDYANLNIVVPSDEWKMLSKPEIYDYHTSLGVNVLFDEESQETYAEAGSTVVEYYDMVMINAVNNESVQVIAVDKGEESSLTLNDYFNSIETQLSDLYTDASFEPAGVMTIGGNIYSVSECTASVNGVGLVQYYAGANVGNGFVIMAATFRADSQKNFLEFFESIVVD